MAHARRHKRGKWPTAIAGRYRRRLVRRTITIHTLLMEELGSAIERNAFELERLARTDDAQTRADNAATILAELIQIIRSVQMSVRSLFVPNTEDLVRVGESIDRFTTGSIANDLDVKAAGLGAIGLNQAIRAWALQQVQALQEGVDARFFEDIAKHLTRALKEPGTKAPDLKKVIARRFVAAKKRAAINAKNAIGTLNAEVTQARFEHAGIVEFTWSDSGDEKVREVHELANGNNYPTSSGHPTEGFPGEPFACRCAAIPVIPKGSPLLLK